MYFLHGDMYNADVFFTWKTMRNIFVHNYNSGSVKIDFGIASTVVTVMISLNSTIARSSK